MIYMNKSKEIKKYIASIFLFALLLFVILSALNVACYDSEGFCTTWNEISEMKELDVLIMGNSHAYCSFVPDIIEGSTGMTCRVLGSSSEGMNVTYENVRSVLRYCKPKVIVLEAYSVCVHTRNETTEERVWTIDNINGIPDVFDRIRAGFNIFGVDDLPWCTFRIFRADRRWTRWSHISENLKDDKVHLNRYQGYDVSGYRYRNSFTDGVGDPSSVADACRQIYSSGDYTVEVYDEVCEKAYIEFLELAEENGISVIIASAPTLEASRCGALVRMKEIAEEYSCVKEFRDFNLSLDKINLTLEDFYDSSHLNRRGASKFTRYFLEQMIIPKQPTPDFFKVFAYDTEYVKSLGNKLNRFTMKAYGDGVKYCFYLDGEIIKPWSNENFVDLELEPEEADRISVAMAPPDATFKNIDEVQLKLRFMNQNDSIVNIE